MPPPTDGRTAGAVRPGQIAVQRYTGHVSPEPAQFILDVQSMLLSTNNAAAKELGNQLRQLWGSNQLTASQQTAIAGLSQKILDKKMRPIPHLTAFYSALVGGKNKLKLSDAQVDQYLDVVGQSVEKDSPADLEKYLLATTRLLNGGSLHRSSFNSLRVVGGQLAFAYKAAPTVDPNATFDAPASPAPLPPAAPAKAAAKPVVKAAPKPAAKKKRASDGWDTADLWSTPSSKTASKNDGWGSANDGWSTSAPKKKAAANDGWGSTNDGWGAPAPKKKTVAKITPKAPAKVAAKPVAAAPAPSTADFDQANAPFIPSPSAAYEAYYAPPVSGPVIELKDADLIMGTAGDSIVLHRVSGTLATHSNRFVATGAEVTWAIKGNPVSAALAGFDFDPSKPEFTAQPVTLTYPFLLEEPVKGALSYKSVRRRPGATEADYPRFISLTNDVRLKDLGPGIKYRGGLSMAGSRLLSAALDGSVSNLMVSQDGKLRFRATSRSYVLGDSLITASRAAIALYASSGDSITHPGVELKYSKSKEQLKLLYEKGLYRNTSYSDSYHQIDIRAQMLVWNLREPKMDFSIITSPTQVSADFESKNFFSNTRYQQLKSINHLHPLQMLLGYSGSHGNASVLNLHDVAVATQTSEPNLRSAVTGLARDGFVDIQPQTGQVILLRKARSYVGAAREKKDYDHILLKSVSGSGRSATLNLANNQLLLRGVKQFAFTDDSAAVPVIVRPDSGLVRIEHNRDMHFGGRVKTSIYGFKGHNFKFDYDGYYIDMPVIDSLSVQSKAKKTAGKSTDPDHQPSDFVLAKKGKSQSGRLYLNDPTNRSGRKKMAKYPSFNSTSGAYVYFDKPDVLGGAYDTTTYFDVPPFSVDSMGTGKSRGKFVGVFHSPALPPIKTALTMQADGIMGFVHTVPAGGYPMYGGKGQLSGGAKVRLNKGGLQSNGTITYQGASLQSDRFVMYADSVTGEGKTGAIAASSYSPKVVLPPGYLINWRARKDSLHLRTPPDGAVAKIYADHTFKGSLLLTPAMVGGAGRLDGPQSYVRSQSIVFKNDAYSADKALLSIKSSKAGKPALIASDMKLTYDLQHGYAEFTREEASKATIDLPFTGFQTSLSGGRWDFKKKQVLLRAGADAAQSYFTSKLPEQFGLKFRAETASYDLAKYKLQVAGVPYIAIADSWVLPDSGKVAILPGGNFQKLERAKVLMDSVSKFHELYLGNLVLKSRVEFVGQAKYTFKYANGDSVALTFSDFRPDSSAFKPLAAGAAAKKRGLFAGKTADTPVPTQGGVALTGAAKVQASDNFNLAPRIGYRGEVTLNSKRRGLAFQGEVKLSFAKNKGSAEWVAMRDTVNPKSIAIKLEDVKAEDGTPLTAGLMTGDDPPGLYPLYFGTLAAAADHPIFQVDGTLRYDTKSGIYSLTRADFTDPNQYEGANLTFAENTDNLTWRGPLKLLATEKNFTVTGAAVGTAHPDSAAYRMHALLGFDIAMPIKGLEALTAGMTKLTKNSAEAISGAPDDLFNIAQVGGNQAARSFADHKMGAAPDALQKLSPKFLSTLVINRVDLRWSAKERAWYSVGRLGLGGVGKQPFNALMDGLLEVKRVDGQDYVELYLEPSPGLFYYFRFEKNVLVTQSLDEKYDYAISSKAKYDYNTATQYGVFVGDLDEVEAFRTRFRRTYLNESDKETIARRKANAALEEKLAQEKAAEEEAAAAAIEAKKNKKRKPDEAADDPAADPNAPSEPPTEVSKKKKKGKDNDPFGDGEIIAAPAAEPAQKKKAKVEAATEEPAPEPAKKKKKAKDNDPLGDSEVAPTVAPAPAKKKEKVQEATPDPNAEPAPDPAKKKKKKKGEEDPFGDS